MNIKTAFSNGQTVYVLLNNQTVQKCVIDRISVDIPNDDQPSKIQYHFKHEDDVVCYSAMEFEIYSSPQKIQKRLESDAEDNIKEVMGDLYQAPQKRSKAKTKKK
jgi:hypothetical protein